MEPTAPTPHAGRWQPSRRRLLWAAIVLLALSLLWTAAALYAPPLIRHEIETLGSDKLGRAVTVGPVSFKPWTLEATLDDLRVAGAAAGDAPQLQIKRLHVDAAWQSLLRLAPVIDAVEVDTPAVRLTRVADGRYDIDDVLDRLAAQSSSSNKNPEPARFAVHNIVVSHGSADFADVPVQSTHRIRDLDLAVPFISSLPAQRKVKVEPHLAFTLDGSRFDSAAAATPFDASVPGTATLSLKGFDIAPWLGYVPRGLPVQLRSALLEADLRVAFEQQPKLSLRISGTVGASHIQVADGAARDLLDVGSISVAIDELRPLEEVAKLRRIDIAAPHLLATRDAAGKINLLLAAQAPGGAPQPVVRVPLPKSAASAAAGTSGAGAAAAASAPGSVAPSAWKLSLAELAVRAGKIEWHDAAIAPAVALGLDDFTLDAQAIQWPIDAPVVFKGEGSLGAGSNRGKVVFSGSGNATQANVKVAVDALPLALAGPYLHGVIVPALDGKLSADVAVAWRAAAGAVPHLVVDAKRIAVDALRLGDARNADVAADRIELLDAHVDTTARSATVGRLALVAPRLKLERERDGGWSFERWRVAAAAASAAPPATAIASRDSAASTAHGASKARDADAWKAAVADFALDKGRLSFVDRSQATPVALDVSDLALQLHGFALDNARPTPFHFAARVAVPSGTSGAAVGSGFAGSVDARGDLAGWVDGVPASARAALLLKDLPLHLLAPYFADRLNLVVQKAQTSLRGNVAYERMPAGPRLQLSGDATVDDFRASSTVADAGAPQRALQMLPDASSGRQLLNWKSLSLRGISVAVAPGSATQVSVALTSLSDFFARVVLSDTGRLNLQDLVKTAPAPGGAASSAASASATAVAAATSAAPAAIIHSGPIALVNGRVNYTDLFVKPNYSANLSELNGSLSSFSSVSAAPGEAPQLAALTLRGRVEGSATLEIDGKVNPLAKPLALDLQAKVRDLELPPLSTYSVKYAGYGIERGKMSVDLAYLVKPDGQLTATNKIVLNQLAFGDKVEGAPASLPVKLAVALLADRHGVIDVDLPIGGSINDPQFSLGGLIWQAIKTLVVKAVTAPFSLLASAFGGGGSDQLSTVDFVPGTATLTTAAKASLDKIATALADRPQLTMTVSGESRLDVEQGAWKQERLQQIVRAEKRRTGLGGGGNSDPTVSPAEYPELLKSVYKRADIAKPKNALGFAKDLPTNEMETLLLASITVPDDAMQQLAIRRGVAVRDYLEAHPLPANRLFLGAPKVAPTDAAWTPRADLKLATQ